MTTRRQFIKTGGAALSALGLTGSVASRHGYMSSEALVIRALGFPQSALKVFGGSGPETPFSGDYAALIDQAAKHFSSGGLRLVAAVDHGGALLLATTLRRNPGSRIVEHRLPRHLGQKFKVIIAEQGGKA